ncbi:Ependymin-2 Ependymin II [Channa argus]|uniref:Ependymin-2 Ependymin II n=1 Tax=Channa argus TaxID=215402 RepID=A0A6G1QTV7_CHAAH|nr:Ependymin-2 Ependymin II [Channa argus]
MVVYCHLTPYFVTLWTRTMYAAFMLFLFVCMTATTNADHHQPCHSPNMTGFMSVMNLKGEVKAFGAFAYDSMGKKLRFRSNDSQPTNTSQGLDLLMFFDEGIMYEIDTKNQSCEKKALQCTLHPLDIPDDATFVSTINSGSASIEGEGLKLNMWKGSMADNKGHYCISVTMGCLPVNMFYFTESSSFFFSNTDVELEIKDPDLLLVPTICHDQAVEETVYSFFNEFM